MTEPADTLAGDVPQMRERLAQVQRLVDQAMKLSIETRRVQSHFRTAREADADLAEISLAINLAHTELQVQVAEWLVLGMKR